MAPISLKDEARTALDNLLDYTTHLGAPPLRLGVTGLSRAGKTVFITALVHNLVEGGRLPLFTPQRSGRLRGAGLVRQRHADVPRFEYQAHVRKLVEQRLWPDSTRSISEIRLSIAYDSASFLGRKLGRGKLDIDIVDYPGEWLLDLPLLSKDFGQFSRESIERARQPGREAIAGAWLADLGALNPSSPYDEARASAAHDLFSGYLRAARGDGHGYSMVPPGRFLMPGDLAGSPAVSFAPLDVPPDGTAPEGSLWAEMERGYEAYKDVVVRPFFRTHFAQLDRQVVLVDVLAALNSGPAAVSDLELALADILSCFRPGRSSWLSTILQRRIDRILFAATKADHLHHTSHDRLEAILRRLVDKAMTRAEFAGADVEVRAIAAIRATREARLKRGGEQLSCIIGLPQAGEELDGRHYSGADEIALFPGDLPADPSLVFEGAHQGDESLIPDVRFLRFRPPLLETTDSGVTLSLPHIRLDRALDFLIGDRLT